MKSMIALAFLFIFVSGAFAAPPGGTDKIQGTIKDALGRPLAGASLTLKSPDETILGKTQSDAAGHFMFSGVTPGTYAVLAEKTGFETGTAVVTVEAGTIATATLALTAQKALEMSVMAERLDQARNSLSPKTGGSEYTMTRTILTRSPRAGNPPQSGIASVAGCCQ